MLNVGMRNAKIFGIASLMALGTTSMISCQKETQKPLHNVEIVYADTDSTYQSKKVKMEEGSSFENERKKYVMSNGKLISIDKRTYKYEDTNYIGMKQYELNIFEKIAKLHDEQENCIALSTQDIEMAKEKLPAKQFNRVMTNNGRAKYFGYNTNSDTNGVNVSVTDYGDIVDNVRLEHDAVVYKD